MRITTRDRHFLNLSVAMAINFLLMLYKRKNISVLPRGNVGSEKPGLVKDILKCGRILELEDL